MRKQNKQPYLHEGVVISKVGDFTYEIELEGKRCIYNQSHLKSLKGEVQAEMDWAESAYDEVAVPNTSREAAISSKELVPTRSSCRVKRPPKWFIHE